MADPLTEPTNNNDINFETQEINNNKQEINNKKQQPNQWKQLDETNPQDTHPQDINTQDTHPQDINPQETNLKVSPGFPKHIKNFIETIQTHQIIAEEIFTPMDYKIQDAIPYKATREFELKEHQVLDKKIYIIKDKIIIETLPINLLFSFLTTFLLIICIFKLSTKFLEKKNPKYKKILINFLCFFTPIILAYKFIIWPVFFLYFILFVVIAILMFLKRNLFLIRNCFYVISFIFSILNFVLIFSAFLFLKMLVFKKISINVISFFFTIIFFITFLKDLLYLLSDFFQIHVIYQEKGCLLCKKELFNSITLHCGHAYHYMCIKGYLLLQKSQCPCCFSVVNKEIFSGIYEYFDTIMCSIIGILGNLIGIFLSVVLSLIWVFIGRIEVKTTE
ncbi:RING finger protein [Cucumispora dikerogammari]|nr:RING finger protein [Cucumispora dikerogammari]